MDNSIYDASYYVTGKQSGKSLYENYRWMPGLTVPMCRRIAEFCGIDQDDTILDFGCARGYVVRAFRELGYRTHGIDGSAWAIDNCDPMVKNHVWQRTEVSKEYDWIIAKDVLEHIPDTDLESTVANIFSNARKGVFVVVPLSAEDGAPYVVPEYELDVTHVQRLTLGGWVTRLQAHGFCTAACHRVPGVKDNYSHFEQGNGFLVARREIEAS